MSKPRPVSRRALGQVAVATLVAVLVGAGISWLHHGGPAVDHETLPRLDEAIPILELAACERTLPGEDDEEVVAGPIGRITSGEATACPRRFDGRLVTYIGEVVGDILRRDGGAWVQVNDDGYALEVGPLPAHRDFAGSNSGLSVWLPDDVVDVVSEPGRRGVRGDVILVEGVLLRSDPDDGGGLTVRATTARLVAPAATIDQPFHLAQAIAAAIAAVVAIGLTVQERRARQRR